MLELLCFPDLTQGKAVIGKKEIYEVIYDEEIYEAIYNKEVFQLMTTTPHWRKAKINGEMYVFLYNFVTFDNNLSS